MRGGARGMMGGKGIAWFTCFVILFFLTSFKIEITINLLI